jgi:methylated-DNA-protein-cysteine methyltransferase related protein
MGLGDQCWKLAFPLRGIAETMRVNPRLQIYDIVREIPAGWVATYGQVATRAGLPGHARQVGYALSALPEDTDVPWQRVVNSKGEISPRSWSDGSEDFQRQLLEEEGIVFTDAAKIRLADYRWAPDDSPDR